MYYFTFVLCMRPRLMSKQAIMARALIYKSLSLFMIKSLKTKLGRADVKAFRPSHATCGIIQRLDCSSSSFCSASISLVLKYFLMYSSEYFSNVKLCRFIITTANVQTFSANQHIMELWAPRC